MDRLNNIILLEILDIVTVSSNKGRYELIENRESYGLSLCIEGQITYTHNGKNYVADKNHAVILPENQTYTLHGDKKGIFPLINFKCRDFLCDTIMLLPIKDAMPYLADYEQMKSLFLFKKYKAKVISIFYQIIFRLFSENNAEPGILALITDYLENNFQDPDITNLTLAQKFRISEVYLRKLFLRYYQITPKQYIIDIRINKAKQLLSDGVLKINAISKSCGFSNQYHFCRVFKKKVGITPTEYMRKYRIYKI